MGSLLNRVSALALVLTGAVASPAPVSGGEPGSRFLEPDVESLLRPGLVPSAPPPDDPQGRLAAVVAGLGAALGRPLPGGAPGVLAAARLSPELAGRVALALEALAGCQDATDRLLERLPGPPSPEFDPQVRPAGPPEGASALRACAARLQARGLELERSVSAARVGLAGGSDVDLWPVLRLDLDGSDDTVAHDYVLSVDAGGDDVYLNNAGGNLIDVRRGPAGSGAMSTGPARGCVNPAYDLLAGECVISEALLVDAAGNDTYGRAAPPDPELDGLCTADPLVHRVATGGVGSWGVGILLDGGGDDRYLGKSVTLGAGHFGGVGILVDASGDDTYEAIRLAKGFGTLFGVGVFHDAGGDDVYSYYMPRPLDPAAEDRTLGAGGALDTGGTCDRISRWEGGSGFLGGVGVFLDDAGDDVYSVAPPSPHEPGASELIRPTGSLGFGDAGFGLFVDGSGTDRYDGMPGRADGETVGPSDASQGFFHDGGGAAGRAGAGSAGGPAGPGGPALTAWFTHYIPDTVAIDQGGSLQFFNPDLYGGPFGGRRHSVTEVRPEGGPPRFDAFVGWGEVAPITGVEGLAPGRYPFTCRVHPFMHGMLVVR